MENLLTINKYSRPGTKIIKTKAIVLHWVGNPNQGAESVRKFFESLKSQGDDGTKFASAHEIIDTDGSRLVCIPEAEMAYHVGAQNYMPGVQSRIGRYPNSFTYGIELCHIDWSGNITEDTRKSAIERVVELLLKYNLDPIDDVYRHYDITGKPCPYYFVKHPKEWERLKEEIKEAYYKRLPN